MSYKSTPSLDDFLDSPSNPSNDFLDSTDLPSTSPVVSLPEGTIDPRLQLLSHSSRTLLHTCPRKYQLYRMSAKKTEIDDMSSSVTFAYGTAVGAGIQSSLESKTKDQVLLDVFLAWDTDLLASNQKQKKSIWEAIFAVQRFIDIRDQGYLQDYELVYYGGKPAVELSFQVLLPDGYVYRGFVDVVLQHKTSGKILVVELKTTSMNPISTIYKNSGQALGYSVVLDKIFPDLSSYEVLYLVYGTKSRAFTEFYFEKSLFQRALWLQELLIDTDIISLYNEYDVFPMHGESCYSFFKDCEYLGMCTLSTKNLVAPLRESDLERLEADGDNYQFTVSFEELIESQLNKGDI